MKQPQIYLIDVDRNLTKEVCWTPQECLQATPDQEMIDYVNLLYKSNFIIIYTARVDGLTQATKDWLYQHRVKYREYDNTKPPGIIVDRDAINKVEEL